MDTAPWATTDLLSVFTAGFLVLSVIAFAVLTQVRTRRFREELAFLAGKINALERLALDGVATQGELTYTLQEVSVRLSRIENLLGMHHGHTAPTGEPQDTSIPATDSEHA